MDRLVPVLFKHPWSVFTKGEFGFANRPSWILILLIVLALALLVYFLYIRPGYRISSASQAGLMALRAGLLALLALLLMRPVMVVPSIIPKSTSVAVLADDSRSMQLNDQSERTRLEAVKELLNPEQKFARGLDEKFKVNLYSFGHGLAKISAPAALNGEGRATDLAGALGDVVKESSGLPLSAIVLLSDGGANTPRDLSAQLRELRARNVPIFAVGVGSPDRFKDAEMMRVTAPQRVLLGSAISAEALLRAQGYGPSKVVVAVSEDGRAIKTEPVDLRGVEAQSVTIEFTPPSPGIHRYTFEIKPLDGEMTIENNAQEALVQVVDEHPKVLYLEGEPRWEYGKMRTSLTKNEKNLVLVSVLRSADGKFYRQGVESGAELENGFPATTEELFKYQGFVLGSLEANFFSYDQLKLIEQFVARRGGGFLALGGSRAFDAGKYASTPIADLLPLELNDRVEEAEMPLYSNFKALLTPRGRTHAVTRLNEDRALSAKAWEEMPPISIPEVLSTLKPGATAILEARSTVDKGRTVPLLAEERYGRGRTLALTANDTWRWRMELDSKNISHETFWRQLLRYLVSAAPNPIEVASERDVYALGDQIHLRAEAHDAKFEPLKEATLLARVTKPSGESIDLPLTYSVGEESNDYRAELSTNETGLYQVDLSVRRGGAPVGSARTSFLVTERTREFNDAIQNVELLKRMAAETGGKYYPLERAHDLLEEITFLEGNNSERVTKDLWDMPINLMLLLGLAGGEWFLRKRKGLA